MTLSLSSRREGLICYVVGEDKKQEDKIKNNEETRNIKKYKR